MIPGILASMFVIPKGNVFYGVVVGKSARMVPVEYKDGAWTIQDIIPNSYLAELSNEGTLVLSPGGGTSSSVNHYQYNGSKFELVGGVANVEPYPMGNRCISGDGQHMITSTSRSSGIQSLSYILLFSKNASGIFESKGQIGPNNTSTNMGKMASDYFGQHVLLPRSGQTTTILYKSGNSWLQHDLVGRTNDPNYRMSSVPKDDELRIINHSASQLFLHRFNTTTKTSTFNAYPHFKINTSDIFKAAAISRNGEHIATVAQISGIQNTYITIIKIEANSVTHTFLPIMYETQSTDIAINHDGTVVYITEQRSHRMIVWTRSGTVWTRQTNLDIVINLTVRVSDLTAN